MRVFKNGFVLEPMRPGGFDGRGAVTGPRPAVYQKRKRCLEAVPGMPGQPLAHLLHLAGRYLGSLANRGHRQREQNAGQAFRCRNVFLHEL